MKSIASNLITPSSNNEQDRSNPSSQVEMITDICSMEIYYEMRISINCSSRSPFRNTRKSESLILASSTGTIPSTRRTYINISTKNHS